MERNYKCRVETVACAVCGATKREANHWPMLAVYDHPPETTRSGRHLLAITLVAGEEHIPTTQVCPDIYEVCGSSCELKLIEQLRNPKQEAKG